MKDKEYYEKMIEDIKNEHPFLNNTELAYEVILQEILSGEWKQGEKIPQESIAIALNMSRTPIRDALIRLSEELFLENGDNNGYTVRKIELKDYVDFCEFRLCLETKAAYMAARNITTKQLGLLKENVDRLKNIAEKGQMYQFLLLDNEFHTLIAEASDNTYIYETIKKYRNKEIFNMNSIVNEHSVRYVINKHISIYEAIKDGDEELAEKMMRSHLQFYIKNIYFVYK